MIFGMTSGKHLTMATSVNMFYITIDSKNKANMKVAASNIKIEMHQAVSKMQITGVHLTTAQQKISGNLTQNCF